MTAGEIKSGKCPYCGGPYTLSRTCNGPRTATPGENACPGMSLHIVVIAALREGRNAKEEEE